MTLTEAKAFAARTVAEHPEGCSCGATDCLSNSDSDYDTIEAELVRDQTDWESHTKKKAFCKEHGIPCI